LSLGVAVLIKLIGVEIWNYRIQPIKTEQFLLKIIALGIVLVAIWANSNKLPLVLAFACSIILIYLVTTIIHRTTEKFKSK
jgi:hypothetical protein